MLQCLLSDYCPTVVTQLTQARLVRRSLVAVIVGQMPFHFHSVVKHAPDTDQLRTGAAIQQKVPRVMDDAAFMLCPVAAMAEMIAAYVFAKLRTADASDSLGFGGEVAQRDDEQALIAQTCLFAEAFVRPCQNLDDVGLRRRGKTEIGHCGYVLALRIRVSASRPRPAI